MHGEREQVFGDESWPPKRKKAVIFDNHSTALGIAMAYKWWSSTSMVSYTIIEFMSVRAFRTSRSELWWSDTRTRYIRVSKVGTTWFIATRIHWYRISNTMIYQWIKEDNTHFDLLFCPRWYERRWETERCAWMIYQTNVNKLYEGLICCVVCSKRN